MLAKNSTQYESKALAFYYNLADAHTHQYQSATQQQIIDNLPVLFREAENLKQPDLDWAAIEAFHQLCSQAKALEVGRSLICYSASMAMEVVANYLRRHRISLALIEPTFDNIPDILIRHNVNIEPIYDEVLQQENPATILSQIETDGFFFTLPNNPTGTYLRNKDFYSVATFCAEHNKLLAIDASFRLYEPGFLYDQYEILEDVKARYIFIEDTGKTWPTLDLKVGFLNASRDIQAELRDIHSDFMLNASPFVLRLLLEYFKDSEADSFQSVRGLIEQNRNCLRTQIHNTFLSPVYEHSNISVELLRIKGNMSARDLHSYLASEGVFVLPGNHFYWSRFGHGDSFIRIALARDPTMFRSAILAMVALLKEDTLLDNLDNSRFS